VVDAVARRLSQVLGVVPHPFQIHVGVLDAKALLAFLLRQVLRDHGIDKGFDRVAERIQHVTLGQDHRLGPCLVQAEQGGATLVQHLQCDLAHVLQLAQPCADGDGRHTDELITEKARHCRSLGWRPFLDDERRQPFDLRHKGEEERADAHVKDGVGIGDLARQAG